MVVTLYFDSSFGLAVSPLLLFTRQFMVLESLVALAIFLTFGDFDIHLRFGRGLLQNQGRLQEEEPTVRTRHRTRGCAVQRQRRQVARTA